VLEVGLAVDLEFSHRLHDDSVGDEHLVLGLEPVVIPPAGADIGGGLHIEPVRHQALDARRRPRLGRTRREVLPDANHDVPPARELAAVEGVRLRVVQLAAEALPFGAEPQAIPVAADPALGVPSEPVIAAPQLPFELVEQHEEVDVVVVHRVTVDVGERRRPIRIGNRRDWCGLVRAGAGWCGQARGLDHRSGLRVSRLREGRKRPPDHQRGDERGGEPTSPHARPGSDNTAPQAPRARWAPQAP
jgi:hypothetical protein